jgi:uncharacterized phage protein (TIGR01671 family)
MNKSNIEAGQAETTVDSNSTAQNQQVSQPNANTNVVGSLVGQREIKFRCYYHNKMHGNIEALRIIYNEAGGFNWTTAEIMQYTGLKDKNGKEIYEGDILKSNYSLPLVVVFSDGKFCFYNSHSSGSDVLSQMRVEKLGIIGNIFENPELLQAIW